MTRAEHASLRAIKDALQDHRLTTEQRTGLTDALETLRDYYAAREVEQTLETLIGELYKPHFGTEQTPEQAAYNTAIRDALKIIKERREGIA